MNARFILPPAWALVVALLGCAAPSEFRDEMRADRSTIRVGTYNMKDLFDEVDDPTKNDGPPTPPEQFEALAEVIKTIDCDILAVQEVENLSLLEEFNREYLGGLYSRVILIEGNDPRGIDVGVLSKIPLMDVRSHREMESPAPGGGEQAEFSRDLLVLSWLGPDGVKWTLMTTHLKAGRTAADCVRRTTQAEAIAKICRGEGYVSQWGRGMLILTGDLNAEPGAPEIRALNRVPFSDPARDYPWRGTHASGMALDYVLLSPEADARYVVGSVTVYRNPPVSRASDHFPVYVDLRY